MIAIHMDCCRADPSTACASDLSASHAGELCPDGCALSGAAGEPAPIAAEQEQPVAGQGQREPVAGSMSAIDKPSLTTISGRSVLMSK